MTSLEPCRDVAEALARAARLSAAGKRLAASRPPVSDLVADPAGVDHVHTCPTVTALRVRSSLGRGPCTCVPGVTIKRTIPKRPRRYDPRAVEPTPDVARPPRRNR